jgi:hypothetical protein
MVSEVTGSADNPLENGFLNNAMILHDIADIALMDM